jgi:hypothetical protein
LPRTQRKGVERPQAVEHLHGLRARGHVPAEEDRVHPLAVDLGQHRLERVGHAVDVVEGRDAHACRG